MVPGSATTCTRCGGSVAEPDTAASCVAFGWDFAEATDNGGGCICSFYPLPAEDDLKELIRREAARAARRGILPAPPEPCRSLIPRQPARVWRRPVVWNRRRREPGRKTIGR